MTNNRAVTEVLGYVLVIGIVTMMIGTVMTIGIAGLHNSQSAEHTNNMERAYDVLADNFKQIYASDAPSRATEIRLLEGTVRYGEPIAINVTVDDQRVGKMTIWSFPIVFDDGTGTQITYEAGAVIRADGERSVMLREPSFTIDEETAIVPGVRIRPLSGSSERIDRRGTFLVRGDALRTSRVTNRTETPATIRFVVETPRTSAWDRYFTDMELSETEVTTEGNQVIMTLEADAYSVTLIEQRIRTNLQD